MGEKLKCYLGAPLFTPTERTRNERLAKALEETLDVYLPQRDGLLLAELKLRGADVSTASREIFRRDVDAIAESSLFVAILEGAAIDDGVAFELGAASALGVQCVGVASDSRRAEGYFRNPMWIGALDHVFGSDDDLISHVRRIAREDGL